MNLDNFIRHYLVQVWWSAFQLGQGFPDLSLMDERILQNEELTATRQKAITKAQTKILTRLTKPRVPRRA